MDCQPVFPKSPAGNRNPTTAGARISSAFVLRVIYAVCLLAGASTHAATIWRHGVTWNYGGGVPLFTIIYWTSLTFLDPLAAILLFAYPRTGLIATLAIISTDVAHNLWFGMHYHIPFNWMIGAQCAFLLFVLVSFFTLWRSLNSPVPDRSRAAQDRPV